MVPKLLSSGRSFKGLAQYLTHDPNAETAKRVAWTHTLNCTHDNVPSAVHEMYTTQLDAEALKQEVGVPAGGRTLQKPVKHLSLNWHASDEPTREHMIATAEDFLKHMGWHEHQALLVAHDDKEHKHLHVMLNAVHPETGLKLDDSLEKRRAQEWALAYEREQGKIHCEQRLSDPADREPSPTREAWQKLKESEAQHGAAEQARRAWDGSYLAAEDNRQVITGEEWKILKEHQRKEREAFFAEGKDAFGELRKSVYHQVKEEFRNEWAGYYAAKREGHDPDYLAEMRADILQRQNAMLDDRRGEATAELRAGRDAQYADILGSQQEARHELHASQDGGLTSPHLLDLVNDGPHHHQNEATEVPAEWHSEFRAAADEVTAERADEGEPFTFGGAPIDDGSSPNNGRGRDLGGDASSAALGAFAAVGERFFDVFFGGGPPPKREKPPAPEPGKNPFARVAEAAVHRAQQEEESARNRAYWEERERTRD